MTGCAKIENYTDSVFQAWEFSGMRFVHMRWCSFKQTSVCATDVEKWMSVAPSLEYFNLGNLSLSGMQLESKTLTTLLLLNADVSGPFVVSYPLLHKVWAGNGYMGWPYQER